MREITHSFHHDVYVCTDARVMLEIKDKEKSAIKAVKVASHDSRFLKTIENWSGSERKDKS